ncbi:MAG: 50S ribosome-binding GTPase [Planctomycetes bacterium]|nr:50S ribosome-binding GTPase [Planctomycetota bacterium]
MIEILTPTGIGGIAVVRATGPDGARLAGCLRTSSGSVPTVAPGAAPRRALLRCGGEIIDSVLVVDRGSRGFEVHLHGSAAVLAALAREFDCRPWSTGKPAERLLRVALCSTQLELALEQLDGDFEAYCRAVVALPAVDRQRELAAARERSRVAVAQVVAERLVLVGAQNAGKSSLFNRLLFRERVATGPTPGLTRDPVRELTVLEGYPYELVDTAGEGIAREPVDAGAIERGRTLREGALQLLVVDASAGPSAVDRTLARTAALVIANKCDLPAAAWAEDVACHVRLSCVDASAVHVRHRVGEALRQLRRLPCGGPVGGPAALDVAELRRLEDLQA